MTSSFKNHSFLPACESSLFLPPQGVQTRSSFNPTHPQQAWHIPPYSLFYQREREREKSLSHVRLFATPWTIAYHAPLSMGFSKQEYWSGLPIPSPKDLLDPGIKPRSPALQADALSSEPPGKSSFIKTSPLLLRTNMFFIPLGINWARKRWSSRTCAV